MQSTEREYASIVGCEKRSYYTDSTHITTLNVIAIQHIFLIKKRKREKKEKRKRAPNNVLQEIYNIIFYIPHTVIREKKRIKRKDRNEIKQYIGGRCDCHGAIYLHAGLALISARGKQGETSSFT